MKAAGAASPQNGVWVLPAERVIQELRLSEATGAQGQAFAATLSEAVRKISYTDSGACALKNIPC
jgi:hypothetical protein